MLRLSSNSHARRGGIPAKVGIAMTSVLLLVTGLCSTTVLAASIKNGPQPGLRPRDTTVSPGALSPIALNSVGTVNLSALAGPSPSHPLHSSDVPAQVNRQMPLGLIHRMRGSALTPLTAGPHLTVPTNQPLASFTRNNPGATSFDGISSATNGSLNSPALGGFGDVSPPDQALAVGKGPSGTTIVEAVNDTFTVYSPSGQTLLPPVADFQVFDQPPQTALSDPRAYWDPTSGHWILAMFAYGSSGGTVGQYGCSNFGAVQNGCLAAQYIAVSKTTNPMGSYDVFWFDTTDGTNPGQPGGNIGDNCPCFGDYDQIGADANGIYISTNEFSLGNGNFNGNVIYAISKSQLLAAAGGGSLPQVERIGDSFNSDPFGGYHLSPSTVTQGSSAPSTEYFTESNALLPTATSIGSGLEILALLDTSVLNSGGTPAFHMTTVATDPYTGSPPMAVQKSGPMPLGVLLGTGVNSPLDTDFNSTEATTYAGGELYTELNTGFMLGNEENAAAEWFVVTPTANTTSVSATTASDGYVESTQNILFPVIGVDASGHGYMSFSLSGPAMYPSAGYVTFDGTHGAGDVIHVAGAGADPIDDFSCYSPYTQTSPASCRWGDYSASQAYGGNIYMASEYVPPDVRDTYTNWGTRVYWASDQGYWLASSDGSVFATGNAPALAGTKVSGGASIAGIAAAPSGEGYWLVGKTGTVYSRGDAKFYGDLHTKGVKASDIVAIDPTADGTGYWLLGANGAVYPFGSAHSHGSLPGLHIKASNIVGMAATPAGDGYWLVNSTGGLFFFGTAHNYGSLPGKGVTVTDITAILASPAGTGYELVGANGKVYPFGTGLPFHGSIPSTSKVQDIVSATLTPDSAGYWLAGSGGTVHSLGDAVGQKAQSGVASNLPIVGIAGT